MPRHTPNIPGRLMVTLAGAALVAVLAGWGVPSLSARSAISAPSGSTRPQPSSRCFGAATTALQHPCLDSALKYTVVPSLKVAKATPNAPCTTAHREGPLFICTFGAPAAKARRTIALIGDSHAAVWRATLAPIARAEHWHGISIVHPGCPFSALTRSVDPSRDASCTKWRLAVIPWLRHHRQVSAIFVGGLSSSPFIRTPGEPNFAAATAGYRQVWQEIPATVQHIVVMRDTPRFGRGNHACLARAIVTHAQASLSCAVARPIAAPPDPEAAAAASLHSPRLQLIDVNNEICDSRLCYPVVGGVLVLKDPTHLTRAFATTLTPAVMRQVRALTQSWKPARS